MGKPKILTKPTKKHIRFANLVKHNENNPKDKRSEAHLAKSKWDDYRQ